MIPLHNVAADVVAAVIRRQPASAARTAFAWEIAVGPALAKATTIDMRDDGALQVLARDEHWAREVERAADTILQRLRALLGPAVVRIQVAVRKTTDDGRTVPRGFT